MKIILIKHESCVDDEVGYIVEKFLLYYLNILFNFGDSEWHDKQKLCTLLLVRLSINREFIE